MPYIELIGKGNPARRWRKQMTAKEFQKRAKEAFLRQNPDATIGWLKAPRLVTFPTGVKEWQWSFYASAEGYRSREMTATGDDTYVMVR